MLYLGEKREKQTCKQFACTQYLFIFWLLSCRYSKHKSFFQTGIFKSFIYLFYFWLWWVFVTACRLFLVAATLCFWCMSFSLQWFLLSWSTDSRCMGLSSCGEQVYFLLGMRDLPRSGVEPMSLALSGKFLTTEPLGKSSISHFLVKISCLFEYIPWD